jgi:hypothetical protein
MTHLLAHTLGILALSTSLAWIPNLARATPFVPPADNRAPRSSTGGATRGGFIPPSDQAAPSQATGGATRSGFVPPAENAAPRQASGGATRDGFIPPSDNALPTSATGGSSRTNLYGHLPSQSGEIVSMLAITPQSFYGTTLLERPTMLIYVPESGAVDAIFSLKDEAGHIIYQTRIAVPGQSGVVAVQIPADAPALEVGKNYQWLFALLVDGTLSPSTPYVDAWIKRIQPSPELAQQLQRGSLQQNAEILASQGVWYDSAALFAELQMQADPTVNPTLMQDWQELLNSVGLETVAAAYAER